MLSPEKESGEVLKCEGTSEPARELLTPDLWALPREFLGSDKFPGSADLDSALGEYCLETGVTVLGAAVCWGRLVELPSGGGPVREGTCTCFSYLTFNPVTHLVRLQNSAKYCFDVS